MSYEVLAECRTYPQLIAALRERLAGLGTTAGNIEIMSDLTRGHLCQLLSAHPKRGLGNYTLGPLLEIGGMMLLVVVDPTTIGAAQRWAERKQVSLTRAPKGAKFDIDARASMLAHKKADGGLTSERARQMNLRWKLLVGKRRRRAIAKHAAKARWRRRTKRKP